ncbi:hypothetical protein TNCV_2605241 [Trichonephila clavipes]|nr:hypothetical protein TNCV_250441 [Trichonephila clavipes]GFW93407.1 hypothetical protein TNCV_2605241 [Trichonephila clavipes]
MRNRTKNSILPRARKPNKLSHDHLGAAESYNTDTEPHDLVYLTISAIHISAGQRVRSPTTKNCAPQATAVCGCGERQPTDVQWKVSARGSLLCDQGIPSASKNSPGENISDLKDIDRHKIPSKWERHTLHHLSEIC